MFEHFTFGAQAQIQNHEELPASPTDTCFPSSISPPPSLLPTEWEETQPELNTIVHQMSRQSLSHENEQPQQSIWQTRTPSSPIVDFDQCDPFEFAELNFVSTVRGMTTVKASYDTAPVALQAPAPFGNGKVACKRVQRVRNTQKQSCAKHVKGINALVEDMVENNSQCTLRKTTSRPCLTSPPPSRGGMNDPQLALDPHIFYYEQRSLTPDSEDEGVADMEELLEIKERISLRRVRMSSGVSKNNNVPRPRGSAENVGSSRSVNGTLQVRSFPRMRKRTKKRDVVLES